MPHTPPEPTTTQTDERQSKASTAQQTPCELVKENHKHPIIEANLLIEKHSSAFVDDTTQDSITIVAGTTKTHDSAEDDLLGATQSIAYGKSIPTANLHHSNRTFYLEEKSRVKKFGKMLHKIFPAIPQVTNYNLRVYQASFTQIDINRTPLLQFTFLQITFWCNVLHRRLDNTKITPRDIQELFISLFELHRFVLKRDPRAAHEFATECRRITIIFAELGSCLNRITNSPPLDFYRVSMLLIEQSEEYLQNYPDLSKDVEIVPTVSNIKTQKLLGFGGFGSVYKAEYTPANFTCTLKLVLLKAFRKVEHRYADRICATVVYHPCIVEYYGIFCVDAATLTLMEYIRGVDLQRVCDVLQNFRIAECQIILAQLVSGIMHLHFQGMLHRDIKASNVIMVYGMHVKIIDFDTTKACLAHYPDRFIINFFKRTPNEFRDKEKAGTLPYTCPEIVLCKAYGRSADWWSTGCLLYKLVVGRTPFRAKNDRIMKVAICRNQITFPLTSGGRSRELVTDMILKLLKKRPSKRLGSERYQDLLRHEFLSTVDWFNLSADAPICDTPEAYSKVLMAASRYRSTEVPSDSVLRRMSPQASKGNSASKDIRRLSDYSDASGDHHPIFTYFSPTFRSHLAPDSVHMEPPAMSQLIKPVDPASSCFILRYNNTREVGRLSAETVKVPLSTKHRLLGVIRQYGFKFEMVLAEDESTCCVVTAITNKAVSLCGLLEGDIIVSVDGNSTLDCTKSNVESMLRHSGKDFVVLGVLCSTISRMSRTRTDVTQIMQLYQISEVTLKPKGSSWFGLHSGYGITVADITYYNKDTNVMDVSTVIIYVDMAVTRDYQIYSGDIVYSFEGISEEHVRSAKVQERLSRSHGDIHMKILCSSSLRLGRPRFDRLLNTLLRDSVETKQLNEVVAIDESHDNYSEKLHKYVKGGEKDECENPDLDLGLRFNDELSEDIRTRPAKVELKRAQDRSPVPTELQAPPDGVLAILKPEAHQSPGV